MRCHELEITGLLLIEYLALFPVFLHETSVAVPSRPGGMFTTPGAWKNDL